MKRQFLALSVFMLLPNQSSALLGVGDVVFDPSVFGETVMTATESVNQTLKQVEQYSLQLQQYENQIKNTVAPAAYVWDQANATISKVMGMVDTLNYYKSQAGNLDGYLSKFQNTGYYRSSPCYSANGCSATDQQAISNNQVLGSEAQKRANDAVLRGVDQQQTQLAADAAQLSRLQSSAQGAQGQMEALGYANQLASSEINQLMQIREILLAQQAATATRAEVVVDREAQEQAASDLFRSGAYTKSSGRNW
jgi:P-type conjugative transfer protein TrbJ